MARAITPIQSREESVSFRAIHRMYWACPAKACWWQNDRNFARPGEFFLEGFDSLDSLHFVQEEGIGEFLSARQVTGHIITVNCWERHNEEEYDEYDEGDDEDEEGEEKEVGL